MVDADEILRAYVARSAHVGQAAEYLAMDYAVALAEIDALRTRAQAKVSFGFLRAGMAGGTTGVREADPEPLMP